MPHGKYCTRFYKHSQNMILVHTKIFIVTMLSQSHMFVSRPHPKGSGHTCKIPRMCCISSLHLESRNHICPLPITNFLTREDSRLVPRSFENGNEASRLFCKPQLSGALSILTITRLLLLPQDLPAVDS